MARRRACRAGSGKRRLCRRFFRRVACSGLRRPPAVSCRSSRVALSGGNRPPEAVLPKSLAASVARLLGKGKGSRYGHGPAAANVGRQGATFDGSRLQHSFESPPTVDYDSARLRCRSQEPEDARPHHCWGRDALIHSSETRRRVESTMPNAQLHYLEQAFHHLPNQRETIFNFLRGKQMGRIP